MIFLGCLAMVSLFYFLNCIFFTANDSSLNSVTGFKMMFGSKNSGNMHPGHSLFFARLHNALKPAVLSISLRDDVFKLPTEGRNGQIPTEPSGKIDKSDVPAKHLSFFRLISRKYAEICSVKKLLL